MRNSVFSHYSLRKAGRAMFAVCVLFCGSTTSRADDLTIRAAFDGKASVLPNERIDLLLSRALQPADGSLAVLVGDTDRHHQPTPRPASPVRGDGCSVRLEAARPAR